MTKEERRKKDPLSLRFEDWPELYSTWGVVHKVVVVVFPILLVMIAFYSILCELEYLLRIR